MAITIEDGTGLANADSYLSVADADSYHAKHGNSLDWEQKRDNPTKEEALRIATQYLDLVYLGRWRGRQSSREQALSWPRAFVVDEEGFGRDSNVLPQELKDATAELALKQLTESGGLIPDIDTNRSISTKRVKVGPIEQTVEYSGSKPVIKRFRKVDLILITLLKATVTERA
jgi:hypothetical protein